MTALHSATGSHARQSKVPAVVHTSVEKTTIYFPAELKRAVRRYASRRGISKAEVIRRAVADAVADDEIPRPRGALFSSDVLMADDVDTRLDGFGLR